jgi:DNA modification methylase
MKDVSAESVNLIVTSPPYPMIEMWDSIFAAQNEGIADKFEKQNSYQTYELMHHELDKVWEECLRVLKPGGIVCVNIGDATRTLNKNFALYPSHARIVQKFLQLGFDNLPNIIWRKQTNAPNKFMGSGMLPGGAYVTLEHEWILIFRKGGKREFKTESDKLNRQQSAYFWEERNVWFSDLWDLKGTKQKIKTAVNRERSAAYPLEIPLRLINMYSVYGDTVLDPFLGTGTTTQAAIATGRNSIGYEIDESFKSLIFDNIFHPNINALNRAIADRLESHKVFIDSRKLDPTKSTVKHFNEYLKMDVITAQEKNIVFNYVSAIHQMNDNIVVEYSEEIPHSIHIESVEHTCSQSQLF